MDGNKKQNVEKLRIWQERNEISHEERGNQEIRKRRTKGRHGLDGERNRRLQ